MNIFWRVYYLCFELTLNHYGYKHCNKTGYSFTASTVVFILSNTLLDILLLQEVNRIPTDMVTPFINIGKDFSNSSMVVM